MLIFFRPKICCSLYNCFQKKYQMLWIKWFGKCYFSETQTEVLILILFWLKNLRLWVWIWYWWNAKYCTTGQGRDVPQDAYEYQCCTQCTEMFNNTYQHCNLRIKNTSTVIYEYVMIMNVNVTRKSQLKNNRQKSFKGLKQGMKSWTFWLVDKLWSVPQ